MNAHAGLYAFCILTPFVRTAPPGSIWEKRGISP